VFQPQCLDDLAHWIETDRAVATRLVRLVQETLRSPFTGVGKPEPLKYLEPNTWSRRLTDTDRLVYYVEQTRVVFISARYHYPG
jgi:toxin YoeB